MLLCSISRSSAFLRDLARTHKSSVREVGGHSRAPAQSSACGLAGLSDDQNGHDRGLERCERVTKESNAASLAPPGRVKPRQQPRRRAPVVTSLGRDDGNELLFLNRVLHRGAEPVGRRRLRYSTTRLSNVVHQPQMETTLTSGVRGRPTRSDCSRGGRRASLPGSGSRTRHEHIRARSPPACRERSRVRSRQPCTSGVLSPLGASYPRDAADGGRAPGDALMSELVDRPWPAQAFGNKCP
jgi:hypothetical protein